jgi:DNA-directed RNA polymerase subunit K/omega
MEDDLFSMKSEEEEELDEEDDDEEYEDDLVEGEEEKQIFKKEEEEDEAHLLSDEEENDNESDYADEEYFQKLNSKMRADFVTSYHPQLQLPVNDEIQRLCVIQRNEKGEIDDPFHKTAPFVTKYEKTNIIGSRALQLQNGSEPLLPTEDMRDEIAIATEEFRQKLLPFIVWRPFPHGGGEYWKLSDLEII